MTAPRTASRPHRSGFLGFCVNSPEAMRSSSVFARTGAHARRAWTRAGRPPTRSERAEAPPSARPYPSDGARMAFAHASMETRLPRGTGAGEARGPAEADAACVNILAAVRGSLERARSAARSKVCQTRASRREG